MVFPSRARLAPRRQAPIQERSLCHQAKCLVIQEHANWQTPPARGIDNGHSSFDKLVKLVGVDLSNYVWYRRRAFEIQATRSAEVRWKRQMLRGQIVHETCLLYTS